MKLITETHADHIRGVLSCYDRIIIQGTLPPFCYAEGMTSFLYKQKIRIFDYKQHFAQPLRDAIIHNANNLPTIMVLQSNTCGKRTFGKKTVSLIFSKKEETIPALFTSFQRRFWRLSPCVYKITKWLVHAYSF